MNTTLVGLYVERDSGPRLVAHFRWSAEEGVSLDLLDPDWSSYARTCYEKGVLFERERRVVTRDEGQLFMQVLLERRRTSYYYFVDESELDER